jgi:hypothetical protein
LFSLLPFRPSAVGAETKGRPASPIQLGAGNPASVKKWHAHAHAAHTHTQTLNTTSSKQKNDEMYKEEITRQI